MRAFAAACLLIGVAIAANPYYVVITDPHLDTTYKSGAPVHCTAGTFGLPCCHDLAVGTGKSGPFGEPTCDVSERFFKEMLVELKKLYPNPEMIFFLGDAAPHTVVTATYKFVLESYTKIFDAINNTFPKVPVFPLEGNHDTYPCNLLSARDNRTIVKELATLFNTYNYVNDAESMKTLHQWLYYTRQLYPGLRLVALNSLWNYGSNSELKKNDKDPAGMRAWLTNVISKSASIGEKVWLLGHIRPVGGNNHNNFVQWFTDLLAQYPGTIIRQHYGHSHTDELHIIRPGYGKDASTVCFVHPGATSFEGIWPSVRVARFNPTTFEETEIKTYHVDIAASNKANRVYLTMYYDFADTYSMADLTQASWNKLAASMLNNEYNAGTYLRLKSTKGDEPAASCDAACRKNVFCDMNYMPDALRSQCQQNPQ